VIRAAGPWTGTVHALLRHLRSGGLEWVPEPLGRLADGREVLSWAARLDALCAAYAGGGAAAVKGCSPAEVLAMAGPRVEELTAARAAAERSTELAEHVALYRRDAEHLRDLVGEIRRMGG